MKKSGLSFCEFMDEFNSSGRGEQFSYDGLKALYNYLLEEEEVTGEEYDLDVIALCCEFSEDTISDTLDAYTLNSIDELKSNTIVIEVDENKIIIMSY